mgnify:FL=1|jgi:hypothetical protein
MKEISRITISGSSGYCSVYEAYEDKIAIEPGAIRYDYKPMIESEINPVRKWSYRTTSPIFQKIYKEAAAEVEKILNWGEIPFCTDLGVTTFTVTYDDKSKAKRDFILPGDDFKKCFKIIKQLVPDCEYVPAVLLTSEDNEENVGR